MTSLDAGSAGNAPGFPFRLPLDGCYGALRRRQPVLAAFTLLMLAAAAPTLLAMALDARTFNGINVWIKPPKFELSTAIHMATLALFWPFIHEKLRSGRAFRIAPWVIAAVFMFEVGYIGFRAALAEASHFNESTPVAAAMYAAMGVGIVIVMAITVWIGIGVLRSGAGGISAAMRLAIGVGLILGSVLATISGGYMSALQHSHWVGGAATDAGGIPFFGWSRSGGDLRAAHFLGLHAMQGLPMVGWLLQRAPGRGVVVTAALIWTAATGAVFFQALQGHPLLPF